uniref:uncharacterized protein LOC122608146 n=1 Tax=Erigeron canadensis TaxID=72917 RepID=UPI001CB93935|nr:uncharacterized protein LOC122608146 [Erigeron canadensis]
MEDSMIDRPSMAFDEKVNIIGNKRDRNGDEEIVLGRLEKRPSGILGVDEEGKQNNGGIIDTFISNVFHNKNNESVTTKEECEVVEDKGDSLGVDENVENGGREGGGEGGVVVIKDFFSNIFQRNGNDDNINEAKNDPVNEVVDKKEDEVGTIYIDGNFENGGGEELKDLNNAEKLVEKHDVVVGSDHLPSKDLEAGNKSKMKPDDYSERVFFLNNN